MRPKRYIPKENNHLYMWRESDSKRKKAMTRGRKLTESCDKRQKADRKL